jgi:hypothetical protein
MLSTTTGACLRTAAAVFEFGVELTCRARICSGKHVWDLHFDRITNIIDVYVGRVRRKID